MTTPDAIAIFAVDRSDENGICALVDAVCSDDQSGEVHCECTLIVRGHNGKAFIVIEWFGIPFEDVRDSMRTVLGDRLGERYVRALHRGSTPIAQETSRLIASGEWAGATRISGSAAARTLLRGN